MITLLTTSNPKTLKSQGFGIATAVLHLSPSKLSGRNVCPHASESCILACLNLAGRGGIFRAGESTNAIQDARIARTQFFHADREAFLLQLCDEISRFIRRCENAGMTPAIRLNGTSDLPWEKFPVLTYPNVFAMFSRVQFYDYTKWPVRLRASVADIPNYSLTFSLSEHPASEDRAVDALAGGTNVAVVFDIPKGRELPAEYFGVPVIDGDVTDLRYMDPTGVVVGLRAKGPARGTGTENGFVRVA